MKENSIIISIVGNYSLKNRGDEILLKGTIKLLQYLFGEKGMKFNIYLINPNEEVKFFSNEERKNVRFFSSPIIFTGSKLRSLYLLAWSFLYRVFNSGSLIKLLKREDREAVLALIQSDLIIYRSIDQISDIFGFSTFFNNLCYVIFCYNLKKRRLLLHSQTIYLSNRFRKIHKFIAMFLIKMISRKIRITLRDYFSKDWFCQNRIPYFSVIPPPSIIITYEVAKKCMYYKEKKLNNKIRILIVPRISTLKRGRKREAYTKLIESLLLKYPNLELFLMGQSYERLFGDDDYIEINNIINSITIQQYKIKVFDIRKMNLVDILKSLLSFDCIISERALTAVNALSLGIPTIVLDPYGGKNIGFARLFGFEKFACSIESFNPHMVLKWMDDILINKESYRKFLIKKAKELYYKAIIETQKLVRHALDKS